MITRAISTPKLSPGCPPLFEVIDTAISALPEACVVAISSKIVSICEGRTIPAEGAIKDELVAAEASYYLPRASNPYGAMITITGNTLVGSAGIDESNADGHYVLWPSDPQASANAVRAYLCQRFGLTYVGVVVVDSVSAPLRLGAHGTALAHSGFVGVKSYVGEDDLFGRKLKVSRANIAEGLAATANLVMGEGAEQTPIVILEDLPFVQFQSRNPTSDELAAIKITIENDKFSLILKSAPWKKGGRNV